MRSCRQCGLSIGDTSAFCPVCGALADPADAPAPAPPEPEPGASAAPAMAPVSEPGSGTAESRMPEAAAPAPAPAASAPGEEASPGFPGASDLESEAHRCEKADPPLAAALYRQAIIEYLASQDDPLGDPLVRRDLQRAFDRLSLVLKRSDLPEEALEEIDSAAYLGLLDADGRGSKTRREALVKRRDSLRRGVRKTTPEPA